MRYLIPHFLFHPFQTLNRMAMHEGFPEDFAGNTRTRRQYRVINIVCEIWWLFMVREGMCEFRGLTKTLINTMWQDSYYENRIRGEASEAFHRSLSDFLQISKNAFSLPFWYKGANTLKELKISIKDIHIMAVTLNGMIGMDGINGSLCFHWLLQPYFTHSTTTKSDVMIMKSIYQNFRHCGWSTYKHCKAFPLPVLQSSVNFR